jgi:16S rRNA (guanine(966)-N(2))-methyltransferase RsmD
MRIIAGRYRGRRLKSPPSLQTRPTSDRLRETLFNILARRIEGARFVDLCAGSGAVGIEALSRGAAHVTFVDRSRKMYALIQTNLKELAVDDDEIEVVSREAFDFLRKHARMEAEPFDIVFLDPPYASDYEEVLEYIGEYAGRLISKEGMIIVEHGKRTVLPEGFTELQRFRSLRQGDSCLSFYKIRG